MPRAEKAIIIDLPEKNFRRKKPVIRLMPECANGHSKPVNAIMGV